MIINLHAFIEEEREHWRALEEMLERIERDPAIKLGLNEARRLHYLYQRAAADLARIKTFAAERELSRYLETLLTRAYGEIHQPPRRAARFNPLPWLTGTLPQTFRRHLRAFGLSCAALLAGSLLGGMALLFQPEAKEIIMPFPGLLESPSKRVDQEEKQKGDRLEGEKTSFSAMLMTNNIKVSLLTFVMGMTLGLGTLILLFYNGVILGAVVIDYIMDGQSRFLLGWLLPHGSIEIPAILIAGQAGLVLARGVIGWGERVSFHQRMTRIAPDLMTLLFGLALMLVWAGIIEAFFSQYHEPVIPYNVKIAFGLAELTGLVLFLSLMGRRNKTEAAKNQ